ncbi:MAG: Trm112 family protein [Alphaproteobacteria bacterium]|nr:Trm112 family protein [Alphaproteobacteria bacterium]
MKEETPLISERLLRLLRCPMTGVELELKGDSLVNEKFEISYPIVDGVPVMLPSSKHRIQRRKKKRSLNVDSH